MTRAEYNDLIEVLNARGEIIDGLRRDLDVQFKRIAQIQAELDTIKHAWTKMRASAADRKST